MNSNFLITTTNTIDGVKICKYLSPVNANIVTGTAFFSDIAASFSDVFGGHSRSYQKQIQSLYDEMIKVLRLRATEIGANAVIGLKVDFGEISGKAKQMFMINAIGTAVLTEQSDITDKKQDNIVTGNEINEKIKLIEIQNKIQRHKLSFTDEEWKLIIKYPHNKTTKSFLDTLLYLSEKEMLASQQQYLDLTCEYFSKVSRDSVLEIIYSYFKEQVQMRPVLKWVIEQENLLDLNKTLEILLGNDFQLQADCLDILCFQKDYYIPDDIPIMNEIIDKLNVIFSNNPNYKYRAFKASKILSKEIEILKDTFSHAYSL